MKRALISALVLGSLAVPAVAKATMMEQLDTKRLTKFSKSIHIGQVVKQWPSWDPSRHIYFTHTVFRVEQTLKGSGADTVEIVSPGGQGEEYGTIVHGMVRFSPGEKALVFLEEGKTGNPSVVGMAQGKFHIGKSLVTGEDMAMFNAPADVEFFTHGQQGRIRHVVSSQVERKIPLNTLIGEIRSAVAQEGEILKP